MGATNQEKKLLHKVYYYVSRSLFKNQRLTFALHLSYKLNPDDFGPNVCILYLIK